MADKGTTWWNGTGVVTRPGSVAAPPSPRAELVRTLLIAGAITACSTLFLHLVPDEWMWECLRIMAVGLVVLASYYLPIGNAKPAFMIWFIMLIAECIFFREGDLNSSAAAYAGQFPTAAYGEALAWIMCFFAAFVCATRVPGFVKLLFEGDYKWVTLFTLISVLSCAYTPRISLGGVWGFKLALVTLLLLACSFRIRDFKDTISFLQYTVWAYAIIVLQPVIVAAMRGEMFDEEGRMSTIVSPNALSPNAAIVLLLTLTLFSNRKGQGLHKSAVLLGIVGLLVMILAGSKTGILACVVAGAVFYIIRGRLGTAFTYMAGTGVLVTVLVLTTPLGDYFHLYQDREGAESFSGRTILWKAVLPEIEHKPVVGHGYMATEFLMFQVNAVGWAAPHLHNGFLEAAYNTGAIGLFFMLMILIVIPRNLLRVLRKVPKDDPLYRVAAGCFALFTFLVINGFFNSSFGGKCTAPFMVLLGLVIVSQKLIEMADSQSGATGGLARL